MDDRRSAALSAPAAVRQLDADRDHPPLAAPVSRARAPRPATVARAWPVYAVWALLAAAVAILAVNRRDV